MSERVHTIIVGGGQSGLALSRCLLDDGIEHIVLEASGQPGQTWRKRWDSFTLVTPNFYVRLPGAEYSGPEPEGFLRRDEIVSYLESYAGGLPVRYHQRVSAVEPLDAGSGYRVRTDQGELQARNVVIAIGAFQNPKVPAYSSNLPGRLVQIHSDQYHSPASLPDGAVLVVGSGQSGCQITEELYKRGRKVYLSVGSAGRVPRRYRGHDVVWWLDKIGFFDQTAEQLPGPQARFRPNPHLSGKDGGHELNLHQFARDRVSLLGHVQGGAGEVLQIGRNLKENLAKVDQFEADLLKGIDSWMEAAGVEAPLQERVALKDGYAVEETDRLDLSQAGIQSIVWAGGYRHDFSLVHLPVLDDIGYPLHQHGVTAYPGLYFLGLLWQRRRKSSLLSGVGDDARYLAGHIRARDQAPAQ